jgi:hypothetical protein
MYAIDIASEQFSGLSVVKQHRKINEILKEEIKEMHGLQVCVMESYSCLTLLTQHINVNFLAQDLQQVEYSCRNHL